MCLAIPGKIVELLDEERSLAVVDVLGVRRKIDLELVLPEHPTTGDWVLIHVGFALSKISEEQAQDQIRMLMVLGENEAALEEVTGYGGEEPGGRLAANVSEGISSDGTRGT